MADQFDEILGILADARKFVDTEARNSFVRGVARDGWKNLTLARQEIDRRIEPYDRFLNQRLLKQLRSLSESLSPYSVRKAAGDKNRLERARLLSVLSARNDDIKQMDRVVRDWRRATTRDHLFDGHHIVDVDPNLVFVAMPFEPRTEMDELYETIKTALGEVSQTLQPVRADEIPGDRNILEDITRAIRQCALVVAAVHGANANVYFEMGYARALRKKVIAIAKLPSDLRFDIAQYNCIIESDVRVIATKLQEWLANTV